MRKLLVAWLRPRDVVTAEDTLSFGRTLMKLVSHKICPITPPEKYIHWNKNVEDFHKCKNLIIEYPLNIQAKYLPLLGFNMRP